MRLLLLALALGGCAREERDLERTGRAPAESHDSLTQKSAPPAASTAPLPKVPTPANAPACAPPDCSPRACAPIVSLYVRVAGPTSALEAREKYGDPLDVWLGRRELGHVLKTRAETDTKGHIRAAGFEIELCDPDTHLSALVAELKTAGARDLRIEELRDDDAAPRVFFPAPPSNPTPSAPKILESGRGIAEEAPR